MGGELRHVCEYLGVVSVRVMGNNRGIQGMAYGVIRHGVLEFICSVHVSRIFLALLEGRKEGISAVAWQALTPIFDV